MEASLPKMPKAISMHQNRRYKGRGEGEAVKNCQHKNYKKGRERGCYHCTQWANLYEANAYIADIESKALRASKKGKNEKA